MGARVKSEADMEEIMDNLQEQAMEDKKMRSYAVIPPILLDSKERRIKYQNNNGHVEDMEDEYKGRQYINIWTPSEKEIFKEKYLQHPKNFGVVSSYLDKKSVTDCVQYYYLSKKTENYKQLLRKSRLRARSSRNNPQKVSYSQKFVCINCSTTDFLFQFHQVNSSANIPGVDLLSAPGRVTTRLQREQQQKTSGQQGRDSDPQLPSTAASSAGSPTTTSVASPSSSTAPPTTSTTNVQSPTPTIATSGNQTPNPSGTAPTGAPVSPGGNSGESEEKNDGNGSEEGKRASGDDVKDSEEEKSGEIEGDKVENEADEKSSVKEGEVTTQEVMRLVTILF